jgi:hypothetical protein
LAHAEHLDNKIKGIDTGAVPTSPSFKDVPMTPTISKSSSPTPFRLESSPVTSVSRPNSVTPTITNLNAPSTISLKSDEAMESPWNYAIQSDDAVSAFLGESSVVSPTRAHPQLGLNVTNVQANNLTPFGKWENDEDVNECRRCHRKFGLLTRRHHCRFVQNFIAETITNFYKKIKVDMDNSIFFFFVSFFIIIILNFYLMN